MSTPFVHLHLHSEYSLIDGIVRVPALIDAVVAAGMPAVAITDQCNLFAAVKLYRAAEAQGVKPILGADLWLHNDQQARSPDKLVLLAQDSAGYENLSRIISRAFLNRNDYDRPTVLGEWVEELNGGLIALSGGVDGDIARLILGGKDDEAAAQIARWQHAFDDRYYIEVSDCGRENERRYVRGALELAGDRDCPVVATNDVRFLKREQFSAHEARVCIHDGRILDDPKRPRRYTDQQYLRDGDEMAALFSATPGVIENAIEIARRCNVELRFGEYYLPAYPVPKAHTVESHLREKSQAGLADRLERFGLAEGFSNDDYDGRLEHEIDVILEMGFPGYFLIVADFMAWTRSQRIPVGPGRGSGAGSLVAWALGITDIDPLRYDLLFERFLNPERVSMPDFDIDFCMERRDEVIAYVADKYGRDKVSQIITFGSMAAKAVVRDAGRVLGHPYGLVDSIAKLIPMTLGITLDRALAEEAELRRRREEEEEVGELIDLARSLEGLARNAGKHAGGVVIAPERLVKFAPLYCERGSDSIVTQFDKDDVERIGLVKFDFLGLKTLTILDWAVETINTRRADDEPVELDTLPDRDAKTVKLLQECQTTAVFQLESRGMKDLMRRLKPQGFEDIVPLVALFRPGPLDSGMVTTYVDCKHGRQPVVYPHPKLEPILKPTYGVILYQEQVMQIAQVLAGYSLGAADLLRRAMGKKKASEMAKQRQIFVDGAAERDVDRTLANSIFDLMETFAGYGFNKSHSVAYAVLSYQTAFLKANYAAEYMAAVLSADMDHTDKIVLLIDDARQLGLTIEPPDVNRSSYRFEVSGDAGVVYGLGAIKGVGKGAIDAIIEARQRKPFESLGDFLDRVDLQRLNKRVLEALVQCGAMDNLGGHRAQLMAALPELLRGAEQASRDRAMGQNDMFGSPSEPTQTSPMRDIPPWPDDRRLRAEKETLGLYLTGHPIDEHLPAIEKFTSCRLGKLSNIVKTDAPSNGDGKRRRGPETPVTLAGTVVDVRRRGGTMGFVQLDDGSGRVEVALYRDAFSEYGPLLHKDEILIVIGGCATDYFSGGFNVKAKEVLTLADATERFASRVHMELDGEESSVEALRDALERHSGSTPVIVQFCSHGAKTRLELGPEWKVRASRELIERLSSLPGVSRAGITYHGYTDGSA